VGIRFSRKKERNKFARLQCLVSDRPTIKRSNGLVWTHLVFDYSKISYPRQLSRYLTDNPPRCHSGQIPGRPTVVFRTWPNSVFFGTGQYLRKDWKSGRSPINWVGNSSGQSPGSYTINWVLTTMCSEVIKLGIRNLRKKSLVVSAPVNPKGEALLFKWWPLKYLTRLQLL